MEREPAFNWWVPHVIKKRKMIIDKVKLRARYLEKNEKYGIKVPKNMAEAKKFDEMAAAVDSNRRGG